MTDAVSSVADEPIHVESEDQFRELTAGDGVVLVDFYADWCGPCKMMEPALEAVAAETDAVVAKVDVDVHQALARTFGVQGIPNMVFFTDGEPTKRVVGVQGKDALVSIVESVRG